MKALVLVLLCLSLWRPTFSRPTWTQKSTAVEQRASRTADVTWDKTSLSILGQRVFIQSGEFHPFRLPVRDLWWVELFFATRGVARLMPPCCRRDVLQKMHAGGLNTVR